MVISGGEWGEEGVMGDGEWWGVMGDTYLTQKPHQSH